MKKLISIIFILFLVGCSKGKYLTCDIDVENNIQNYVMTGTYKIYYDNNYVKKIEKKEKYISSDRSIINYFDEYKNLEYYNLKDLYGGIEYKINKNETSVNLNVNINLDLVDIKNMLKNGYINKDYIISNKLTTSGIVKFYESKGAKCHI